MSICLTSLYYFALAEQYAKTEATRRQGNRHACSRTDSLCTASQLLRTHYIKHQHEELAFAHKPPPGSGLTATYNDLNIGGGRRHLQGSQKARRPAHPPRSRPHRTSLSQSLSSQQALQGPPQVPYPPFPPRPQPRRSRPLLSTPYTPIPPMPAAHSDRVGGSVPSSPLPGSLCPDAREVLSRTNAYRALHRSDPLEWDPLLASSSQTFAEELVGRGCAGTLSHAHDFGYGENVMSLLRYPAPNGSACMDATESWYGESWSYLFGSPRPYTDNTGKEVGHFTQMVWRNSSAMGCGVAVSEAPLRFPSGTIHTGGCKVVVCRYFPAGNVPDNQHFRENVLAPFPPPP
ncbi:hypothetical protein PLESTB_000687000 [Pleodorina starrii]|uniref:SCP domain-containing protein n=1 Tax=Pleodorina starrii TaxID=330485 RepID=A0A9W6BJF0_9CHLO|nr:hypothetical protein PLESTB_000687000 [Pleodorina starrii]